MQNRYYCRWAPSLGALEGTHHEAWGTYTYYWRKHRYEPCVFFGLYDLRDYLALWHHRGKAWVLWAGSDIRNLRSEFVFNDGKLAFLSLLLRGFFTKWVYRVLEKAEHWVENEAEAWQLHHLPYGKSFKVSIGPSFMGRVSKYRVCFRPGNKVYLSASPGRQREYGWRLVEEIAWAVPEIEFHLYGASWPTQHSNVIVHGRVPKHTMNREISRMQCGLRPNKHDGFSEITAKSILWGQYPITYLYYPHVYQYAGDNDGFVDTAASKLRLVRLLKALPKKRQANKTARAYYLKAINRYPWVQKKRK